MISVSPFRFDGDDIIVEPEMLLYESFKIVWDSTKDKDLRLSYFKYIYHCGDYNSAPNKKGLTINETKAWAKEHSKLSDKVIPAYVDDAVTYYKREFLSPLKEQSMELVKGFNKNTKILEKININIDKTLNSAELTVEQIAALLTLQKQIIDISTMLPKQIALLKEVDKLIEEDRNVNLGRGKVEIEESMISDDELEKYIINKGGVL